MQTLLKTGFTLAALVLASASAQADWVLPPGANAHLGGGTATLGCASLHSGGVLGLDDGALLGARDVTLAASAQLAVGAGRVELAQQWSNLGSVTLTSGQVQRKDASPGCPALGPVGPLLPATSPSTPSPQPVPTLTQWGALLLSALAGLLGARQLRRSTGSRASRFFV